MPVLLIDDNARAEIKRVLDYAKNNIFSEKYLTAIKAKTKLPAGDNANHICYIDNGYRVVYSMDEKNGELYHHISISVDRKDKFPSIPAVEVIMKEFGMNPNVQECNHVYIENNIETPLGLVTDAINLIQRKSE